jgi:hypothetical protein
MTKVVGGKVSNAFGIMRIHPIRLHRSGILAKESWIFFARIAKNREK